MDNTSSGRALVIGASGLIGSAIVRILERDGIDCVAAYHSRPVQRGIALDITDDSAVRQTFEQVAPTLVFLAANTPGGVDYCEEHPEEAQRLNVRGTSTVARAAASAGARLVYYSTDYIFDGAAGPYSEQDHAAPLSHYGRSKWEAEQIVCAECSNELILRTTAVFGWNLESSNFAMNLWRRLQAGESMGVPSDQWCNPTLAEYLAEVSLRLVQMGVTGVVNASGKDRMTRFDLARALARSMALDSKLLISVSTAESNAKAPRPLAGGFKLEKLEALLGTEALDLAGALTRFRRQWRAETHVTKQRVTANGEAEQLKAEILGRVRQYYHLVHAPRSFVPGQTRLQYAGRVFGEEEMVNLVDSSLDFWLTLGPFGEKFETRMRQLFGARDFLALSSGSSANLCAVMTLMSPQVRNALQPGDEVITPAVTFPTTLAPLVHSGLTPVFVDCELGTYNVDPALVAAAVSERTRAIMIPHTLGNPCDLRAICDVARRHSLFLIEDTCDALGSRLDGKLVGTFGDLATLSFYPAHHITMGEGGGMVVNNPALARVARSVRDWGRDCWCATGESNTCGKRFGWKLGDLPCGYDHKYIYSNLGYNLKPTDMQAAVGVAQLDRLPSFIEARRRNFDSLYAALKKFEEFLILPRAIAGAEPAWFGFPITVRPPVSRNALTQWLEAAKIETRLIFAGNILRQPGYRSIRHCIFGSLENSDRVMRDTFFVGVYPGLAEAQTRYMAERFAEFLHEFTKSHLARSQCSA